MPDMIRAMGSNGVVLEQCLSQMTRRFIDMLNATKQQTSDGSPAPDGAFGEEDPLTEAPPEGQSTPLRANLLGEVQGLMLSYWIQLRALPVDDPELTSTVLSFCSAGGDCRMEPAALARAVAELGPAAAGSEAAAVQGGLVGHLTEQLPRMRRRELVRVAMAARSVAIWHAVTAEVRSWLLRDGVATISMLRQGQDIDDLLAILAHSLAWSQHAPQGGAAASGEGERAATRDLLQRIMHLAVDSLEHVSHKEPELARRRLVATVNTLSAFEQGVPLGSLSRCLHEQATAGPAWDAASAVEVAYSFSALHGGEMPFDVVARLWRLVGGALAEAEAELSDAELAKFWAFALAAMHLSTRSALAALRLAPEGPSVESYLLWKRLAKGQVRFDLAREQQAVGSVASLRAGLPQALPGEVCLEQHAVQGSPYVADFALEGRKAVLVVPRSVHQAADRDGALSGPGRLMQRTLEALGWREVVDSSGSSDEQAAIARLMSELQRFSDFYREKQYGPYRVCYGEVLPGTDVFDCQPLQLAGQVLTLAMGSSFQHPQRQASVREVSSDSFQAFYDMSLVEAQEATANMASIVLVVTVMLGFGLLMSNSIAVVALTPLERMLGVVRGHCKQIFRFAAGIQNDTPDDDDDEDNEFLLLEEVFKKLAAIASLSTLNHEPQVNSNMKEEDVIKLNWMQGATSAVPPHHGGASALVGPRPRNSMTMLAAGTTASAENNPMDADERSPSRSPNRWSRTQSKDGSFMMDCIPPDVLVSLDSPDCDVLEWGKELKLGACGFIIMYKGFSSWWVGENVDGEKLRKFLGVLEKAYEPNHFHSFSHGVDVLYPGLRVEVHALDRRR
ncbi:unnamed protein product [Prorocentrum cordatum]|uniref:Uncharacterized protein n=1 Tax=Prorocentrum cordatum TaxID=2364126 RepID=A0ABN9Y7S3_9DINO|nr:unnamed protein product [Polarella glacialis]